MKIDKIYKHVFNEIIKKHPRLFNLDDDYVFITPNGYYGFFFLKKAVPFNLEMIEETKQKLDLSSSVQEFNLCKLTNQYIANKHFGFVRILKQGGRKIYVQQKFLQYFEDYTSFYQKHDLELIVAVENGQIVCALMPIKWHEGDENE